MGRDPRRAATAPTTGCATSSPTGAPTSAIPSAPGPRSSRSWMDGSRAYQPLNTAPLRKKTPATDICARKSSGRGIGEQRLEQAVRVVASRLDVDAQSRLADGLAGHRPDRDNASALREAVSHRRDE